MSDKYKMHEEERAYFLTLTVVDWIDIFTRRNHKLAIVDSLKYCQDMIVTQEDDYLFSSARNYADRDYLIEIIKESARLITY